MPRKGYKSVTMREDTAERLSKQSEKDRRTISEEIDFWLNGCEEA